MFETSLESNGYCLLLLLLFVLLLYVCFNGLILFLMKYRKCTDMEIYDQIGDAYGRHSIRYLNNTDASKAEINYDLKVKFSFYEALVYFRAIY